MTTPQQTKPAVVCVFCGAISGNNPVHLESARALARTFHENNVQLVYGGGTAGIMGELARTLVSLSGPRAVHGVIPRALVSVEEGYKESNATSTAGATEIAQQRSGGKAPERILPSSGKDAMIEETPYGITTIVEDMHTRKRLMATKVLEGGPGSGFVALAGGFGTMEEVMEMTTWNQLGIHRVGIVLLNVGGYWDGVLAWVRNAVKEGFVSEANSNILVEAKDVNQVLEALRNYKVSEGRLQLKWGQE
ncbi:hypothetical protein DTO166G4_1453 [Paecilomyces variotii]|nr:hypothetical protein DTO166G4_1453 [Paecilomyces variotii]KAJ9242667.1 hypothetical protein DTO166G5_422 [Paecilomyces variotii]KAJ9264404.1 hypothetical protein DTO212C5_7130 [Paecilomyces variotii]KAJ9266534.1 hypothetical protein DTO195F2_1057 [Paecilomyces variotii]KAJ9368698.1 hypothetical protein DTO282E5_6570 [Paecilomyces variotii]